MEEIKLRSLSPNANLEEEDNYKKYKSILDDALSDDKKNTINNIAIAGKYGSGKSSIIDTYFLHKDNYLKVSFATFKKNQDKGQDTKISANIINQIIYQIDTKNIPLTRFKIKRPISKFSKSTYIAELILILSLWVNLKSSIPLKISSWIYEAFHIGRIGLIIVLGIVILWNCFSRIELSKFKLSFKNIETEIDTSNDNLFEKYIDEIIYLFEKSDKSILIIEDLDRFNDLSIFEKLRELNTKLNYKNKKKHWQFIYLIKDDLFSDHNDRVKFFDMIIPIIPYITTNNSFNKFQELFPNNDPRLLNILSLYVYDYRLLLNISNEYKTFSATSATLKNSKEKNLKEENQLLALIAYKNLFPNLFDELQNGQGELAKIVQNYKDNIREQITSIDKQIMDLKVQRDKITANNEVDYLYLWAAKNNLRYIRLGYGEYNISTIDDARDIIKGNNIFTVINGSRQPYSTFKSSNKEYASGIRKVTAFEEDLNELKTQKDRLNKQQLKDIDKDIFDKGSFNEVLYVLIKTGYIKEDYLYVINHYYGDRANRIFMRRLLSESNNFDIHLPLPKINDLLPKLSLSDFSKRQILNLDLVKYCFMNELDTKLSSMIVTASRGKTGILEEAIDDDTDDRNNGELNVKMSFYNKVIEVNPNIHFDLTKFNNDNSILSNIDSIIDHNRYEDVPSNDDILVKVMNNFKDEHSYIAKVNKPVIYISLKKQIVIRLFKPNSINVGDIEDNTLKKLAFQNNKIKKTASNLLSYFELSSKVIDDDFVKFINDDEYELVFDKKLPIEFYEKFVIDEKIENSQYKIVMEQYDKAAFSSVVVKNLSPEKIKILFETNCLKKDTDIIQLLIDKDVEINNTYINDDFKQVIIENKIGLNKRLLLMVLEKADNKSQHIFSRNLKTLTNNEIKNYLKKIDSISTRKILKIIDGDRGIFNFKIDNTEFNLNLFNWMKKKKIIEDFERVKDNKLKVIKKKTDIKN